MFETIPSTWCCTASIVAVGRGEPELLVGIEAEVFGDVEDRVQPAGQALRRFQRAIVSSHHMAHSQRGSRSTGWKFITARNRSTWFMRLLGGVVGSTATGQVILRQAAARLVGPKS